MEVFVSWTGADRIVKNTLIERLRDENIECWDSDEQCTSDYSPECIAAIKKCSVFIVIVSDVSMAKGYVQNEVITARNLENEGRLNMLVYKITDAPYTDAFEFQLNHISFVTGNFVQRKESISGESGIETIVKRTKKLLQKRKEGEPEKPFDVHIPKVDGLEITRTGYFVDHSRDAILSSMEESLKQSNVIVLEELFGFGKRSTIRKYIELHKRDYHTTVLVNNDHNSLRDFFLAGLDFVNINKKAFEALEGDALIKEKFRLLEKLDPKTLLVIPNIKFESRPDELICTKLAGLKCHVILITQESVSQYSDWFPVIKLGRMADDHLSELFFHHYAHAYDEEKEALAKPLKKFFSDIGGHTKTVELTASVLSRDLGIHPEEIPGYLSMNGSEGMQLKDRIINQIAYMFDIEPLSQEEISMLLVASYLAVPYISEKNYRSILKECGIDNWVAVMSLDKRRWLDVDLRNRTVAIEPLIAQIVLNKFPDQYHLIIPCFTYLTDNVVKRFHFSASEVASIAGYSKLEHFFSTTGLSEMAEIISQYKQYTIDKDGFDPQKMAAAVAKFEEKYRAKEPEDDWTDTVYDLEEDLFDPDAETGEDLFAFDAETEEDTEEFSCDQIYDRDMYEDLAHSYIASGILPMAKLISSEINGLLLDFTAESSRVLSDRMDKLDPITFDTETIFGLSKVEMYEWLLAFRENVESDMELDAEDIESVILLETLAAIDAFFQKDYASLMINLNSMLVNINRTPEVLENESSAAAFYCITSLMSKAYINSGAYHHALLFCEKILQLSSCSNQRTVMVKEYIVALRHCGQYTDELYAAYEESIRSFEQESGMIFDSRADMLYAKKEWLLLYAHDLAKGERNEEAEVQFAAAQKLGKELLPDQTAETANELVNTLIHSGLFDEAVRFIERYFNSETSGLLRELGNETTVQILDDFESLKTLTADTESEFTSNSDPEQYISYYHDFSRKNNSLLEQKYYSVADKALTFDFSHLTNEELALYAAQLRQRARREKPLSLAPEAFALASEAGSRVLGYKHHYVQYMGAAAMADGKIAEILNGEGKTYTIVLVAFLNSLYGKKVFVVDSSPFLTKRNYDWMHGVYDLLGVSNDYLRDKRHLPEKRSNHQADVIYASLFDLTLGFLYCETDLKYRRSYLRLDCAIIDEIDNVLVDEAKRLYSVVSSSHSRNVVSWYDIAYRIALQVAFDEEYYTYSRGNVVLKSQIYPLIERCYRVSYGEIDSLDQIKEIEHIVSAAILCCNHYEKDSDYHIRRGIPVFENEQTGIFQEFSASKAYFLCRINHLDTGNVERALQRKTQTLNTICIRDLFKKFKSVCGTTATAVSFRKEFKEIYQLEYVSAPPFCPCVRDDRQSPIYLSITAKDSAIIEMVLEKHRNRQPILMITQSIKESEKYSRLLTRAGVAHKLLNAKNSDDSSDIISMAGALDSVVVATALVNRGTDIKLGGNPELQTRKELVNIGADVTDLDSFIYALPTSEQRETELYKKYYSILEKNRALTAKNRQQVIEAGGLCVIGTSFFPEPRTEQQTRGRSGRQGDVGESWVFRSFEDESIRFLFSESQLDWFKSMCGDDVELNTRLLYKQLHTLQEKMHRSSFAEIRKLNNSSWYIDKARNDFIGRKFDLADGILSAEALLLAWAKDKNILEGLKILQRGGLFNDSRLLTTLYQKHSHALEKAKGSRADRVLFEVLKSEVFQLFELQGYSADEILVNFFISRTLNSWKRYIEIVEKTVGKVNMTDRAMEKYFEAEKKRLLLEPVELLCGLRISKRGEE